MSKACSVLLDSNAYFRLAESIQPLLRDSFGRDPEYSLHVLVDLDEEHAKSSRLKNKFGWVQFPEHRDDRKLRCFKPRGDDAVKIAQTYKYLAHQADDERIDVSKVDLRALAAGFVRQMPVVTDDMGMIRLAELFGIECWSVVKLLRVMRMTDRISSEMVVQVMEYWSYQNDLPMELGRLRVVYREYFGEDCPI